MQANAAERQSLLWWCKRFYPWCVVRFQGSRGLHETQVSLCRDWNVGDCGPSRSRVRNGNSAVTPARLSFSRTSDIFSTGMDTSADEVNKRGIHATSHSHTDLEGNRRQSGSRLQGQEGRPNHPHWTFARRRRHGDGRLSTRQRSSSRARGAV